MTSPTRPLHRSTKNSMIAGVLGGLAEHFDIDPTMLRVVYVVVSLISIAFPGILVYLALWMIIPEDRSAA